MSFLALARIDDPVAARRAFLGQSGLILSGTAVALLAGRDVLAAGAVLSMIHISERTSLDVIAAEV